MVNVFVSLISGADLLEAELELADSVRTLREKSEAVLGLSCALADSAGNIICDDSTVQNMVEHCGTRVTAVIDAATVHARYFSAGAALDNISAEEWEALEAVSLDDYDLPPWPLETCAELLCRILGLKPQQVLDKELEEEEPGERRPRNDFWGTACRHVFSNPRCIAAAAPTGVLPLPPDIVWRVQRIGFVFEFAEKSVGRGEGALDADEGDEDENGEDDDEDEDEEGEGKDANEEVEHNESARDFTHSFAKHPRAALRIFEWALAVHAIVEGPRSKTIA